MKLITRTVVKEKHFAEYLEEITKEVKFTNWTAYDYACKIAYHMSDDYKEEIVIDEDFKDGLLRIIAFVLSIITEDEDGNDTTATTVDKESCETFTSLILSALKNEGLI